MRIRINLATRPYADLGPTLKSLRVAMGVMALLCGLFALGLYAFHARAVAARAREHSLDGRLAAIERERQGYQDLMNRPDNALLLKQAATLNALFDEKAFSWTLAMEDLETVLPGGVQVTTLEPQRAKDGHITLRLRVAGPRDRAVELVQNLEHSRRFLLPRIVSEGAEAVQGSNSQQLEPVSASNRFSFDLLAEYNPAPPGERKQEKKSPETAAAPARPAPARQAAPVIRPAPIPSRPAQMQSRPAAVPAAPRQPAPIQRPGAQPAQAPRVPMRPGNGMALHPRPAQPDEIPEPRQMPGPVPEGDNPGGPQ